MKIAIVVVVLALAFGAGAVYADKPPAPPGQGDCSHGNSGKDCREDPQPGHGKDCEGHGNGGGVNEDHCATQEPTAAPTQPGAAQTPGPTGTVEPTGTPEPAATPEGPAVVVVVTEPPAPDFSGPAEGPQPFVPPTAGDGGLK